MAIATHLTLNSGYQIPTIALGVYQTPPEETEKIVLAALEAGYRHIDSAQYYHNEEDEEYLLYYEDL
ncbi:hypothetical protein JL09_g5412 [Pichia kudriavzevii]|uniref:NADP-dependent oxidoreductase domain-containing protein n=1 Tax=Pichia kudriavzevii TaxID=4909 RepID=A0A099NRR0_PICKU|nr:hypothetical protein JL09_g5412 [Pichia kudriavzevii]